MSQWLSHPCPHAQRIREGKDKLSISTSRACALTKVWPGTVNFIPDIKSCKTRIAITTIIYGHGGIDQWTQQDIIDLLFLALPLYSFGLRCCKSPTSSNDDLQRSVLSRSTATYQNVYAISESWRNKDHCCHYWSQEMLLWAICGWRQEISRSRKQVVVFLAIYNRAAFANLPYLDVGVLAPGSDFRLLQGQVVVAFETNQGRATVQLMQDMCGWSLLVVREGCPIFLHTYVPASVVIPQQCNFRPLQPISFCYAHCIPT